MIHIAFVCLFYFFPSYGSEKGNPAKGSQFHSRWNMPIHVESSTVVKDKGVTIVDDKNQCLACDEEKVVEVTLLIYRPGRQVKKVILSVDI